MRRHVVCILSAALAALSACQEPVATPPAAPAAAMNLGNGVDASATGGGVIALGLPGFSDVHFAFSAIRHGDGRATGQFHQSRSRNGLTVDFKGEVTCLSVDPATHRAWIGGVIKENSSTDPAFQVDTLHQPGMDIWFRVVDYGEGSKSPDDRSTTLGFKWSAGIETSQLYCALQPWPADDARTFPVVKGNIQVH